MAMEHCMAKNEYEDKLFIVEYEGKVFIVEAGNFDDARAIVQEEFR